MIQAIALDDEMPGLMVLQNFCNRTDLVRLSKIFTQPTEALKYLSQFPNDLIFLDIQMPSLNGIDFYKKLNPATPVIFTTAYSQYAVEGFNLQAVDYLLKPFTYERFLQAVNRAGDLIKKTESNKTEANHLLIRADYSLIKIITDDIVYIEGLDDYLRIHLISRKPVIARMTMKSMVEKLPGEFMRVHRSFIVPLKKITSVRNKIIYLDTVEIPIGNSFEQEFKKRFSI